MAGSVFRELLCENLEGLRREPQPEMRHIDLDVIGTAVVWVDAGLPTDDAIAAWLEMMRATSRSGADRDVIFTANTGHEVGQIGLDHYMS